MKLNALFALGMIVCTTILLVCAAILIGHWAMMSMMVMK